MGFQCWSVFICRCSQSGFFALLQVICSHCTFCSLRPHRKIFSLGRIESGYVIFVQKQTTAHFSHPFAISRVSQDPLTVLLWTSKSLLVFRWLWLQLLSLGFIFSFAGFLIGIWILCVILLLTTNGILLYLNLIILHDLVISFPSKLRLFSSYYKLLSEQSFPNLYYSFAEVFY